MKVISGDDAESKAIKLIKNKYALFKVLILVCKETKAKIELSINKIKSVVKSVKVLEFCKGVTDFNIASKLIKNELTEDVGLIVNYSDECVLEAANMVSENVKTLSVLTEPNFLVCLCEHNCLVADYNLIATNSNKTISDCVARISSLAFYLIENAFNKAVFNVDFGTENIVELEEIINALTTLPSAAFKQKFGKVMLIKMCLKLKELISIKGFTNSSVYKLATIIMCSSKHYGLTLGEALLISNTLLFKMFRVLCSAKNLSALEGFNYLCCEKRARKFCQANGEGFKKLNLFVDCNLQKHIENFFKVKPSFLEVLNTYEEICVAHIKIFKSLHNDRGVYLNKYIKEQNIISAVSVLPEQFNRLNFATFIRNVGLLNMLDV